MPSTAQKSEEVTLLLVPVGEQLRTYYELYNFSTVSKKDKEARVLLNTGLLAKIEALQSENRDLKRKIAAA